MAEMMRDAWAVWHPDKGFGRLLYVNADMDHACTDRDAKEIEDGDKRWKVVPVRVVRVDRWAHEA